MKPLVLLLSLLVACASDAERPSTLTNFEETLPPQYDRIGHRGQRYEDQLAALCCRERLAGELPETPAACRQLEREIEGRPRLVYLLKGSQCRDRISVDVLLNAVTRSGGDAAVSELIEREPSDTIQHTLFRQLRNRDLPSVEGELAQEQILRRLNVRELLVALAAGGEDEIRVISKYLDSAYQPERRWAAHVMMYATSLPLDLPELLPVLDRLSKDGDPEVQKRASRAASQYRGWATIDHESAAEVAVGGIGRQEPPGAALGYLSTSYGDTRFLIQLFGRRRVFCDSRVANSALRVLAHADEDDIRDLARRSLDLRRRRCSQ